MSHSCKGIIWLKYKPELRTFLFHISIVASFLTMTISAFGQVSQYASASATVVTPINLVKVDDLDFGNIAASTNDGHVTLLPNSTPTRTASGGVTLPSTIGSVKAGSFSVSGAPGYSFSISLPVSFSIIRENGMESMVVDAFTCNPSPTGNLNDAGLCDLYVGATVHVAASQIPGLYTSSTPFDVTVNYQ